ncbi:Heat shock 70 kDa protein 12A [Mactra antiquata]
MADAIDTPLLMVAIDFGTTFSGFAFQFRHDYTKEDPTHVSSPQVWNDGHVDVSSLKTPTCLLLKKDGSIDSFGFEAERKFAELCIDGDQGDYLFFRRFKMKLNNKALSSSTTITDEQGKPYCAIEVISKSIECLKMKFLDEMNRKNSRVDLEDVLFVLTVPAIWSENAKHFMRQAAVMAGLANKNVTISLEPESASLLCQYLPIDKFSVGSNKQSLGSPGTVYMIVDLGGGTADITVHEKQRNGKLKEVHPACGGPWGGTAVDSFFIQLLSSVVTPLGMSELMYKHCGDYLEFMRTFEVMKRVIDTTSERVINIKVPPSFDEVAKKYVDKTFKEAVASSPHCSQLKVLGDKLKINADLARSLFQKVLDKITPTIDKCISTVKSNEMIKDISIILLVGGFSDSSYVQQYMKNRYETENDITVLVPEEAGLSVLRGAIIYGRQPDSITSRILRYSYGAEVTPKFDPAIHDESRKTRDGERCLHVFRPFKMKDVEVSENEPVRRLYHTTRAEQKTIVLKIFCTEHDDVKYTDDDNCNFVGTLSVSLNEPTMDLQNIDVQYLFGGTEIKVVSTEVNTNKVCETVLKMLE